MTNQGDKPASETYRIAYSGMNYGKTMQTATRIAEILYEMPGLQHVELIVKGEDVEKLKAENARLRKALEYITQITEGALADIAREALAESGGESENADNS